MIHFRLVSALVMLCYSIAFVLSLSLLFFFNDPATTEIYTLSLHDALPIWIRRRRGRRDLCAPPRHLSRPRPGRGRSEEHTSELQSHSDLVCRLLLEKKKKVKILLVARNTT